MSLPMADRLSNLTQMIRLNENEPASKRAKYFQRTNDGKLLLREIMGRHIPSEVVERERQGFSAPDGSWFKGESIDYVRRTVLDRKARIWEILNPDAVLPLVEEHLQGRVNRRLLIWSLLSVEHWYRAFIG